MVPELNTNDQEDDHYLGDSRLGWMVILFVVLVDSAALILIFLWLVDVLHLARV